MCEVVYLMDRLVIFVLLTAEPYDLSWYDNCVDLYYKL